MQKQLKDYTELELKGMAFDCISEIERFQNNLRVINQELAQRKQSVPVITETPKKK